MLDRLNRHDLTDEEWERLRVFLPAAGRPVDRHRRWSGDGTWQEILDGLRAGCDEAEGKDWGLSADSTVVRAHQHAAGARRALPADLVTGGYGLPGLSSAMTVDLLSP